MQAKLLIQSLYLTFCSCEKQVPQASTGSYLKPSLPNLAFRYRSFWYCITSGMQLTLAVWTLNILFSFLRKYASFVPFSCLLCVKLQRQLAMEIQPQENGALWDEIAQDLVRRIYDCPEMYRKNDTITKPVSRGPQQQSSQHQALVK